MLVLTVLRGADKGRCFELPDDEPQLIGRSGESLPLTDQTISRRHAELTPDDGRWYLCDLDSANGTYINGVKVTGRRMLVPGDQIRAGASLFLFGQNHRMLTRGVRLANKSEVDASVEATTASNSETMIRAVPEPSQAAVLQLKVIYELTQLIGSVVNRQKLLERVMELIFDYFQADRGYILLYDARQKEFNPVVIRHRLAPKQTSHSKDKNEAPQPTQEEKKTPADQGPDKDQPDKPPQITISQTIVKHVIQKGEGVLSSNASTDKRFSGSDSVQEYSIRSAMCVPIKFKNHLFGILHIDSQIANYTYTEDQLSLLTAIGVQTGLALANAQHQAARLQRERLAAIGQTVASLSHSIKNILQGLRGGGDVVDLGLRKENMKVVRGGWEIVTRNLDRIYGLTMNMLAFSKQRKPELEMVNVATLLEEIITLTQSQFDSKTAAVISDLDKNMPPVPVDPAGIHQAVLNLVNNALDAVEPGSGVVSLRCEYDSDQQAAKITISDNGEGISNESIQHLFQPFYSTKGLRGTGLGLAVTKKIIEEHGGKITAKSTPGSGTSFTLNLPASKEDVPDSADTHGPAMAAK